MVWAVHAEGSVEYAKPVGEPEESASLRVGASDAVVAHLHLQRAVRDPGGDLRMTGVSAARAWWNWLSSFRCCYSC